MNITKQILVVAVLLLTITTSFGLQFSKVGAAGATISGVVRDASGAALGGVQVLSDNGEPNFTGIRTTTTNPDGSYTLMDVQAGPNHLRAFVSGLAASHYWNFEIQADQAYSGVDFVLRPGGGYISGQVLDAHGVGLGEAEVSILENTNQGFDNGAWAYTTTDNEGYFSTDPAKEGGLPTGRYLVMVTAAVSARKDNVLIVAGQETTGVNLTFHAGDGMIRGRIIEAATNKPIVGASVVADNGLVQTEGISATDGYYRLGGLTTGGYNVVVSKNGFANAHEYGVLVTDGYETTGVDFNLGDKIGQISGRVTTLKGEPLAGVALLADSIEGDGFGNSVSDSNGYYLIKDLAPMSYVVHASHPAYASLNIKALVQQGITTSGIDIRLGSASGSISGKVMKDGQPAALANIYANMRDCEMSCAYGNGIADDDGNYIIENLLPGVYDVHVSSVPGYTNQVRYLVDLDEGSVNGIDFNLSNGDSIVEGIAKDVDGNLLEGARIQFFQVSNPGVWGFVTSDQFGYFSATGLWAGDYHIYGEHINFPTVILSYIPVPEKDPSQIELVFGQERALAVNPPRVSVHLEGSQMISEVVLIDVLAGGPAEWTARSNANWLLLGKSGESQEVSGLTGQDSLVLRFDPAEVDFGRHTTEVQISAPDALPTSLPVTLTKLDPNAISFIYLPLVEASH